MVFWSCLGLVSVPLSRFQLGCFVVIVYVFLVLLSVCLLLVLWRLLFWEFVGVCCVFFRFWWVCVFCAFGLFWLWSFFFLALGFCGGALYLPPLASLPLCPPFFGCILLCLLVCSGDLVCWGLSLVALVDVFFLRFFGLSCCLGFVFFRCLCARFGRGFTWEWFCG